MKKELKWFTRIMCICFILATGANAYAQTAGQLIPPLDEASCAMSGGYIAWAESANGKGELRCFQRKNNITVPACPSNELPKATTDGSFECLRIKDQIDIAPCPSGEALRGANGGTPQCEPHPLSIQCPSGFMSGIGATGKIECIPSTITAISCPFGYIMTGIKADGTANCVAGKLPDILCPSGQFLAGISNGTAVCKTP